MNNEVWIVGKWNECESCKTSWAFQGVYSSESEAVDAALAYEEKESMFVAPSIIG